jgi:hypothetical protein
MWVIAVDERIFTPITVDSHQMANANVDVTFAVSIYSNMIYPGIDPFFRWIALIYF